MEIISEGSHKYVHETELSSFLGKDNKSFVITKIFSAFYREMLLHDTWSLFIGLYKVNSLGFSLVYDLLVDNTRIAKFHARCNYFSLLTRKSFQLSPDILNGLKIQLTEVPHDPLSTKKYPDV
jgi:hypothetical protein